MADESWRTRPCLAASDLEHSLSIRDFCAQNSHYAGNRAKKHSVDNALAVLRLVEMVSWTTSRNIAKQVPAHALQQAGMMILDAK
jgi:hypothetical protein